MPRPRKSTATLEASGAFKHNPDRRRTVDTEPTSSEPIGDAPSCLTEAQKECWNEIVANAQNGVLTKADRVAVELTARLMAKMRDGTATGTENNTLLALTSRFGATPADRNRVTVPVSSKCNLFNE